MNGIILVDGDVMTLGINVGTRLVSLDGTFDGSNDVKLEVLLLGDSLRYAYGKVIGYDEGIKVGSTYDKVLSTIEVFQPKTGFSLSLSGM